MRMAPFLLEWGQGLVGFKAQSDGVCSGEFVEKRRGRDEPVQRTFVRLTPRVRPSPQRFERKARDCIRSVRHGFFPPNEGQRGQFLSLTLGSFVFGMRGGTGNGAWREHMFSHGDLGMSQLLKWRVGASANADDRGFKQTKAGIEVNGRFGGAGWGSVGCPVCNRRRETNVGRG